MRNMGEIKVEFKGIGDNDQMQYLKADIVKACILGLNCALSFYQIDYQAVANAASGKGTVELKDAKLFPVSKIVMDLPAIDVLITELKRLKDQMSVQDKDAK